MQPNTLTGGPRGLERPEGAQDDESEQVEDEHVERRARGLQRPAAAQDDEETKTDDGRHPRSANGAEPT